MRCWRRCAGPRRAGRRLGRGSRGGFTLRGLRAGTYDLTIQVGSFHGRRHVAREGVAAGTTDVRVAGVDDRFFSITGRVVDEAGDALSGVGLSAQALGESAFVDTRRVQTDAAGRFRVAGLAEGDYRLQLGGARKRTHRLAGGDAIAAGTTGLTLRLTKGGSVPGTVRTDIGEPISDATVRLVDGQARARTDAAGRFLLSGLRAGEEAFVLVRAEGRCSAIRRVLPGTRIAPIALAPAVATRGRIVGAAGEPQAGWVVTFFDAETMKPLATAITDAEGRFATRTVPARRHPVRLTRHAGGKTVAGPEGLTVTGGAEAQEIAIE